MALADNDRLSISLLTREYPPFIYGGAGVHVAQLVPQLRKLIDVDVQCMGEPREGATAHPENYPEGGANAALRVFGADLSMVAAIPGSRLATIAAAHLSAVERPEAFTQLLVDFWRSL